MSIAEADRLRAIKTFPSLVKYLRDELDWPIESDDFDNLTFDYEAEELGLDAKSSVKVKEIKQLRPLTSGQPWGIFFVNFEPKRLPVVVLRRILRALVIKKRQSANKSQQAAWQRHDLLFISAYGEADHRDITLANFFEDEENGDLPTLRVLGWDDEDTVLHLAHDDEVLRDKLRWPQDPTDVDAWRQRWSGAFTLKYREVITTSRDLAVRMAELAGAIRKRVNRVLAIESDKGPIRKLMTAFREALIHDLSEDDFADMYAQTITYGLLSARVSRPMGLVAENISDMVPVTNPFLHDLLSQFLTVGGRKGRIDFDELGINDVVQALRDADMEAVLRDFGDRNPQEDPVVHFYELFLTEYDPQKRMHRGVFYTPRPVVQFIVRSVHELLQTEFGIEDGLASTVTWGEMAATHTGLTMPTGTKPSDPFVVILDPAVGTATFLVEVIDVIYRTLVATWKKRGLDAVQQRTAWNGYVPKHLLPRIHGYELMMAPYAIAHMKIGLKLHETGYRFGSAARARIYLTNSLEPPSDDKKQQQEFEQWAPALAHEAHAVNAVKRHQRFTVVIGNPPYSGNSANAGQWISGLVQDYYKVDGAELGERNPKWLQDDYVKFIRLGQFLCSQTPLAVFGFITNHGYIDNPTFRGMRQSLLTTLRELWILDLHGNIKKKETTPDGAFDENVFDIQQGVAVLLAARGTKTAPRLRQSDVFGTRAHKYTILSGNTTSTLTWQEVKPVGPFYVFLPQDEAVAAEYLIYPSIKDIMPVNVLGFQTHRDDFAIAFDRESIVARCEALRDHTLTDAEIRTRYALTDNRDWKLHDVRRAIRGDKNWKSHIIRCLYRPFDVRWCYFSTVAMDYPRRELLDHVAEKENLCLLVPRQISFLPWQHTGVSDTVAESCLVSTKTKEQNYNFPLYLYPKAGSLALESGTRVNFSNSFLSQLAASLDSRPDGPHQTPKGFTPEDVFHYTYALFHSPSYRSRYADFLKMDFPRVPLTGDKDLFHTLARLGGELVALHLMESPKLAKHLTRSVGIRNPEVERVSWSDGTAWVDKEQTAGFVGVPEVVWNFHIGGYQVCDKWLKDRKGRVLSKDDIEHYHHIVVAISETIRLMKEIDKVIDQHGGWPLVGSGGA